MIDIVNELIEIEGVANEILVNAENDKLIFEQVYKLILDELNDKIDFLCEREIKNSKKENLFLKDERINQVSSNYNEYALQMKDEFAKQKNNWLKEIFDTILEDF